jgi:hypothetical protein
METASFLFFFFKKIKRYSEQQEIAPKKMKKAVQNELHCFLYLNSEE